MGAYYFIGRGKIPLQVTQSCFAISFREGLFSGSLMSIFFNRSIRRAFASGGYSGL
jgi:hypothetical protein